MSDYILFFDPGTVNIAYCIVHVNTLKIFKWSLLNIKETTNELMCAKFASLLDTLGLTLNINIIVVIEKQPKINPTTIMVSGFLYMYFTLEKIGYEGDSGKITKIDEHDPKFKLKYYKPREDDEKMPESLDKIKKGHYKNKKMAVEMTFRILVHNDETQEWKDFFKNSKIKGDLADSYLSALSYIEMHKLQKI